MTRDEILRIERIVNEQIVRNTPVTTEVKSTEEAIARGAMALFGEKYGDRVRVVSIPGFSMELCGGTHVRATGDIGAFVIVEESGVAAGVRRIEAVTGAGAVAWVQQQRQSLEGILSALHTTAAQSVDAVHRLQAESKRLAREVDQLKMKVAMGGGRGRQRQAPEGRRRGRRRRRQARDAPRRGPREGRAARPVRFAPRPPRQRRRRPRVRSRRARCRSSCRSRRT